MKKIMTRVLAGGMMFALVMGTVAIANPVTAEAKKVTVKKVTVSAPAGKTAYVAKGKKVKLTTKVKVTPNKKANKKVTFKSADKKIATVSAKGVVKGLKAGKTKIIVTSKKNKKKKTSIKVVVKKAAVKKVKLNTKNFVLSAGSSKKIKATVTPKKGVCTKVAWTTSNKKVAKVSSKGVVKGLADGKAKITAKAADGSGKKASVYVTVGAGISGVSVITSRMIRVTLSGRKALTANNFTVESKSGPTSVKYIPHVVQNASTKDQKVYDVDLENGVSVQSYVRVTIGALATNKSAEIYVDSISGYGDATGEEVTYETGNKDTMGVYDEYWEINNTNAIGNISYTGVSGLPSGLRAYISKDQTSVCVRGKINNVENGTTATLTGTDEKGAVFTKKYVFVIGSKDQMVAVAEPAVTQLTYHPDDPKTIKNEESGYRLDEYKIEDFVHVAGGSADRNYQVTYNGKPLSELIYNKEGDRVAVPAGNYNFDVTYTDEKNSALKASATVSMNLQDGVTVSGMVRDASGQPAKQVSVGGYTKSDANGRHYSMQATTELDGTYTARVLPGDYYTYCEVLYNTYSVSGGNVFNGNTTKDFTLPLYKVIFNINEPGVAGYGSSYMTVMDSYGNRSAVNTFYNSYDKDRSMYCYLKAGNYEVVSSRYDDQESDYGEVRAYAKIEEYTDSNGNKRYETSEPLGWYKVSGAFSVNGNTNVVLNSVKKESTED